MYKFNIYFVCILAAMAYLSLTTANAEEVPDKNVIKVGTYILNSIDTDIRINPTGGSIGTNINYSSDLGGEDKQTTPRLAGYYRFDDTHRIDYGYYKVDRQGLRTLDIDLTIGDETFAGSTSVSSQLNVDIYKFAYTYSFYHNEKVEIGFSAGLHFMDYEFLVNSNNQQTYDSFLAPLPVLGFLMNYNITPKWTTYVQSEIFFIEIEKSYRGSLSDLRFGVEYRAIKNVGFGLSINRMTLAADVNENDFKGSTSDVYTGTNLYGIVYF